MKIVIIVAVNAHETIAASPAIAATFSQSSRTKIEKKKPNAYEDMSRNPVVTVSS